MSLSAQTPHIGAMTEASTAPLAPIIAERLRAALVPTRLEVTNDSDRHRGHSGHDGGGESHFTVTIESPALHSGHASGTRC